MRKQIDNAMPLGVSVLNYTPNPDVYKNDNIHPCVRYIPEGFAGHKWWMTTTPYPNFLDDVENPILYYGDSDTEGVPPVVFSGGVVVNVEDNIAWGYNSDANLFFDGTKLWVFWREVATKSCEQLGVQYALFGKSTTDGVNFSEKKLFASVAEMEIDYEICPSVQKIKGEIKLIGGYQEVSPLRRNRGLCIWKLNGTNLDDGIFEIEYKVPLLTPVGFDFWHFDFFSYENKFYCVASTEAAEKIIMGMSEDGYNFRFWDTPLISEKEDNVQNHFYKPTALVVNDILYLWYPARVQKGNQYMHDIYMTSKPIADVLHILKENENYIR